MEHLLSEIRSCQVCLPHLELGANPILTAHPESRIVLIGQAPGAKVHKTSIPWDDKSGDNLRDWIGINKETFYNPKEIALIPMGFCYPGKGKSGDLPPRKECGPLWHEAVLSKMKNVQLTILVGQYAQTYYLKEKTERTLTETVKNFKNYQPEFFVLPHPSPRNNIWQAKNSWFQEQVIPKLRETVAEILS